MTVRIATPEEIASGKASLATPAEVETILGQAFGALFRRQAELRQSKQAKPSHVIQADVMVETDGEMQPPAEFTLTLAKDNDGPLLVPAEDGEPGIRYVRADLHNQPTEGEQ